MSEEETAKRAAELAALCKLVAEARGQVEMTEALYVRHVGYDTLAVWMAAQSRLALLETQISAKLPF